MEQEELTGIIAKNLTRYRKLANLTQLEVAEKLNYSDKSVSKWEQGNGMPDIFVLEQLSELYGVTVNDFLYVHTEPEKKPRRRDEVNRWMIMIMSAGLCWLVAVVIYVFLSLIEADPEYTWLIFMYAIPAMFIVLVVFSCIWKYYVLRTVTASAIVWTSILALYLSFRPLTRMAYFLFFLGIPIQILLLLWFYFRHRVHKSKKR